MYDLIILGAGPAGLTAAIYAARAGLTFALVEQDGWGGGQISAAHQVQNYPGLPEISGGELGERIREQAVALGAEILLGEIRRVEKLEGSFQVTGAEGETFRAKTVIAATGSVPRQLGLPGETALTGAGVSTCAQCDGAFFAGKDVVVVGGGDTAVEDGLYLSGICRSVTLLVRREVFRGARTRAALLEQRPNVTVLRRTVVTALHGETRLESLTICQGDVSRRLAADGLFVAVGREPAASYLAGLPLRMEGGYVAAGEDGVTSVPGLFVAGDLRRKPLRQAITAAADGANAAASATAYLLERDAQNGGLRHATKDRR